MKKQFKHQAGFFVITSARTSVCGTWHTAKAWAWRARMAGLPAQIKSAPYSAFVF